MLYFHKYISRKLGYRQQEDLKTWMETLSAIDTNKLKTNTLQKGNMRNECY